MWSEESRSVVWSEERMKHYSLLENSLQSNNVEKRCRRLLRSGPVTSFLSATVVYRLHGEPEPLKRRLFSGWLVYNNILIL